MEERQIIVSRRARYYVLGSPGQATDLWVVIHGYGQLAADFAGAFEVLVDDHSAVVAPEALNRYYKDAERQAGPHTDTPVAATWMTRVYRDAEIADYVEYLDKLAAAVRPPGARLGVIAFSQGVATAWRWVALGSTSFDRVIMWAGALPPDLDVTNHRARFPAHGVEIVYGTRDAQLPWIGVEEQRERLTAGGLPFVVTTFDGGHRIDRDTLVALARGASGGRGGRDNDVEG